MPTIQLPGLFPLRSAMPSHPSTRVVETNVSSDPVVVAYRRCCRLWPVAAGHPVRACGLCGQTPTWVGYEDDITPEDLATLHDPQC